MEGSWGDRRARGQQRCTSPSGFHLPCGGRTPRKGEARPARGRHGCPARPAGLQGPRLPLLGPVPPSAYTRYGSRQHCSHGTPESGLRTCSTSIRQVTRAPGLTTGVRSQGAHPPPGCICGLVWPEAALHTRPCMSAQARLALPVATAGGILQTHSQRTLAPRPGRHLPLPVAGKRTAFQAGAPPGARTLPAAACPAQGRSPKFSTVSCGSGVYVEL